MPSGVYVDVRLQTADDGPGTLGSGDDGKVLAWDNGTSNFVMATGGGGGGVSLSADNTWTGDQTFAGDILYQNGRTDPALTPPDGVWSDNGTLKLNAVQSSNNLSNADFESSSPPDSWTTDNADIFADGDVHGGSQALRVEATADNGGVYQSTGLQAGRYYATVWVKVVSGTAILDIYNSDTSTLVDSVTSTATDGWHELAIDFVVPTNASYYFEMRCATSGDIALFDDAALSAIVSGAVNTFSHTVTINENAADGTVGAGFLSNGDFAFLDFTYWTPSDGDWDASTGVATHTPGVEGTLTQDVTLYDNSYYKATFTITGQTAGNVVLTTSDNAFYTYGDVDGTYTQTAFSKVGTLTITLTASADFDGQIDNLAFESIQNVVSLGVFDINGNTQIYLSGQVMTLGSSLIIPTNIPYVDPGSGALWKNGGLVATGYTSLRLGDEGGDPTTGFYDATPILKPTVTGSKGGNEALASLIAALASLGLISDATT